MFNNDGNDKKDKARVCRVLSIGSSLQLNLTLSLTEKQCKEYHIPYNDIDSLRKLKPIFTTDDNSAIKSHLIPLIALSSDNALINSLLFINKANKSKSFIEYIVPFTAQYPNDHSFMKEVVRNVTEHNLIFIEERSMLNIKPEIRFLFKVFAEGDSTIKKQETFLVTDRCQWDEEGDGNGIGNGYDGDLFNGFGFEFHYTIFYSSIIDLFKCKLSNNEEVLSFLNRVIKERPGIIICIDYSGIFDTAKEINIDLIKSISAILQISDMSIFEKKEAADLFNLSQTMGTNKMGLSSSTLSQKKNEQINPEDYFIREIGLSQAKSNVKIGVFIDELKTITTTQQSPNTNIVLFHSKYDIDFFPPKTIASDIAEYSHLLNKRYSYIKSIFLGGFLSRLFNKRVFQACVTAGNESVKRTIDLLRFQLDFPPDPCFYEIVVKKQKSISRQQLRFKKKEEQFLLDCTNVTTSQKRTYNPLYDNMCESYFNNDTNRNHLMKLGFIDKKGRILQDPESIIYRAAKDQLLMKKYLNETKHLAALKEKNQMMKSQIKSIARNLNNINRVSSVDELSYLSRVTKQERFSKRKLPLFAQRMKNMPNGNPNAMATVRHDLYFREIMNSIFFKKSDLRYTNQSFNQRTNNSSSVDRDNFVGLLNDLEKQIRVTKKENAKETCYGISHI